DRPFQASIREWRPAAVKWLPTATQNDFDAQETPASVLRRSPGSVVGTTLHALPSQRSTSVWLTSRRNRLPTAKQNASETQETPVRSPVPASGGGATVRPAVGRRR